MTTASSIAAGLWLAQLSVAPAAPDPEPQIGPWRAWLESPGGELPFALSLAERGDRWAAAVGNGSERIEVPVVAVGDGRVLLEFRHYDSRIVARVSNGGRTLHGEWRKRRGNADWTRMPFFAEAGSGPRFRPLPPGRLRTPWSAVDLSGRWAVRFDSDEDPSVGEFQTAADGGASGTFLTTVGDYRYLAGRVEGRTLRLSCFDGAHAFLFRAELDNDGVLRGDFWSRDSWHDTWSARRDFDARLPDAWGLTAWRGGDLSRLRFPDLDGRLRSLDDPAYRGRARLLVVFGSWCPNCGDATRFLIELHRRYRERGLVILGLAFELTGDPERDRRQVRVYAEHHGIEYPILVAGSADKQRASAALPLLDRVRSYPTTIFMDADGAVRTVHTGFAGPATGERHAKLRARFTSIIEALLDGPPPAGNGR